MNNYLPTARYSIHMAEKLAQKTARQCLSMDIFFSKIGCVIHVCKHSADFPFPENPHCMMTAYMSYGGAKFNSGLHRDKYMNGKILVKGTVPSDWNGLILI